MIGRLLFLPVKGAHPVGVIYYLYRSGLCGQEVVGVVGVETTFQGVKAAGREHCMGPRRPTGPTLLPTRLPENDHLVRCRNFRTHWLQRHIEVSLNPIPDSESSDPEI